MCGSGSDLESRRELLETTRRELGTACHKLEEPSHLFLGKTADYSPEPRYYLLKLGTASTAHSMLFQVLKVHSPHATHQQLENIKSSELCYISPRRWRCGWPLPSKHVLFAPCLLKFSIQHLLIRKILCHSDGYMLPVYLSSQHSLIKKILAT